MKRLLFAATLTVATLSAHAANVGVSVSIGQPGFYGQIELLVAAIRRHASFIVSRW